MTIEEKLKEYILNRYKSLRAFTQLIDEPYSSIESMLRRSDGLLRTSSLTVKKICEALTLDMYALLDGEIKEKNFFKSESYEDIEIGIIDLYRELSEHMQINFCHYLELIQVTDYNMHGMYKHSVTTVPVFKIPEHPVDKLFLLGDDFQIIAYPSKEVPHGTHFGVELSQKLLNESYDEFLPGGRTLKDILVNDKVLFLSRTNDLVTGLGLFYFNNEIIIKNIRQDDKGPLFSTRDKEGNLKKNYLSEDPNLKQYGMALSLPKPLKVKIRYD